MNGLITFRLGARNYATRLVDVREVVRLQGLADMPGMLPPLAGVLELRGTALPVLDLRAGSVDAPGDVLVLQRSDEQGGPVGVAVDAVSAVLAEGELVPAGTAAAEGVLPSYVSEVLRGADGVVFLVDLSLMVESARLAAAR